MRFPKSFFVLLGGWPTLREFFVYLSRQQGERSKFSIGGTTQLILHKTEFPQVSFCVRVLELYPPNNRREYASSG
jgi:hypothetical protein